MPRHVRNPDREIPKKGPEYTHPDRQKSPTPQATRGGAHRAGKNDNTKGGKQNG